VIVLHFYPGAFRVYGILDGIFGGIKSGALRDDRLKETITLFDFFERDIPSCR
jgi:hypothetical protein